jgi:hypothetical protein
MNMQRERERFGQLVREAGIPTDVPINRLPQRQQEQLGQIVVSCVREGDSGREADSGLIDVSEFGVPTVAGVSEATVAAEVDLTPDQRIERMREAGVPMRPTSAAQRRMRRRRELTDRMLREAEALEAAEAVDGLATALIQNASVPLRSDGENREASLGLAMRLNEARRPRVGQDGLLDLEAEGVPVVREPIGGFQAQGGAETLDLSEAGVPTVGGVKRKPTAEILAGEAA